MKYKLLVPFSSKVINIGDYIQALAASKFYPHIDGFVDRDNLSSYNDEECSIIMNAWYMDAPENWPPSIKIRPLYIAVHFNSLIIEKITQGQGNDYLIKHGPIGCRDNFTKDYLIKNDIQAYFSGCLTLTLGAHYKVNTRTNKVVFVEPQIGTKWNLKEMLSVLAYSTMHSRSINIVFKRFVDNHSFLAKYLRVAKYCKEYSKIFTMETLENADYVSHIFSRDEDSVKTNTERLALAEKLVVNYASASLVITSRIHCALPCLGLETPVVFIDNIQTERSSSCRFGGLKELFNVISWDGHKLTPTFATNGLISSSMNIPQNKNNWKPIAEKLYKTTISWVHQIERE